MRLHCGIVTKDQWGRRLPWCDQMLTALGTYVAHANPVIRLDIWQHEALAKNVSTKAKRLQP